MFYDHQDDAQMVFESCYQLVISTAFLARLWNEIWNRDKVSFPKQRDFPKSSPIFSITISERFSLFDIHRRCCYDTVSMFIRGHERSLEYIHEWFGKANSERIFHRITKVYDILFKWVHSILCKSFDEINDDFFKNYDFG